MILDIIVIAIFTIAAVRGKVKGFADSLIRLAGLALGILLGVLFTGRLADLFFVTPLDERMRTGLAERFRGEEINLIELIPDILRRKLEKFGMDGITTTVHHFTNLSFIILAFLVIVLGTWGVSLLLRHRLKKDRKKKNLIGTVDSGVGLLFGVIKGILLVFLFLAFMFPLAGIFLPDYIRAINEQLNHSFFAGVLYDINPLIYFMHRLKI